MNFLKIGRLAAIVMSATVATSMFAQAGRGCGMYDPSTENTLQGTVSAVTTITGRMGWNGVHFTLKTPDGDYDVHVGPSAYVNQSEFTLSDGDPVQVVGSTVVFDGAKSLIARESTKNGKVLSLRDKQGFPLWSGRHRAGRQSD